MRFTHALVRTPGQSLIHGLSTAQLGPPDYALALEQHQLYVNALLQCGVQVLVLPPDEHHPDSTFVEDTALITPQGAIITRPGADSRRGETAAIEQALRPFYPQPGRITDPGTLDAGDVMMVGDHYYIGLSERTSRSGAEQLQTQLEAWQLGATLVPVGAGLHLKSSLAYLENRHLLITPDFADEAIFDDFRKLPVPAAEAYAANCIWVNHTVLVPAGFPQTQAMVEAAGYETIVLNMSEFQKLDGGLSCLSLRFTPPGFATV